jgi:hypothetical protein
VAVRRGYGDETWQLALAGDVDALHRAADALADYDAHRARAFAFAVDGRAADALAQLEAGRTGDWPFAAAYAADVARARLLAGDAAGALDALGDAVRGVEPVEQGVAELVVECARRDHGLRRRALRVALVGGTVRQRLRNALAVLRA